MNHNLLSIILGKSHKIIIANNFYQNSLTSASNYFPQVLKEKYCLNAVAYGNLKYFIILRRNSLKKTNIHFRDNYVIQLASILGHLEIVRYLHQNDANIYEDDDYAFRKACQYGQYELVKYLHQNGADIHDYHRR